MVAMAKIIRKVDKDDNLTCDGKRGLMTKARKKGKEISRCRRG